MASPHGAPKPILKTSLPSAHASTLGTSPKPAASPPPSQQKQQKQQTQQRQQSSQQQPGTQTYGDRRNVNPRHLAIALHHARQIQAQKDAEKLILDRILELIDLPSSPTADPAAPSPADVAKLKSSLVPFQPSDFDNLILERNIEGRCGYALCPREHRKEDPKAKYRIVWGPKGSGPNGRGRDITVVPREKLEMWCSDECAERAMYVRVQLAEQPVWERRPDAAAIELVLLEEARAAKGPKGTKQATQEQNTGQTIKGKERVEVAQSTTDSVADKLKRLTVSNSNSQELARERGDSNPALRDKGRVEVQISEKMPTSTSDAIPAPPVLQAEDQTGGSIEGYVPKNLHEKIKKSSSTATEHSSAVQNQKQDDNEDEDMLDVL